MQLSRGFSTSASEFVRGLCNNFKYIYFFILANIARARRIAGPNVRVCLNVLFICQQTEVPLQLSKWARQFRLLLF